MNSACRLRWLPRFSLGSLLMLMVVVGLCLAWYVDRLKFRDEALTLNHQLDERGKTIESQRTEITQLKVAYLLAIDCSDRDKARELEAFIKVGDSLEKIEKWCGEPAELVGAGDTQSAHYTIGGPGYQVSLDVGSSKGVVTGFGYTKLKQAVWLDKPQYVSLARATTSNGIDSHTQRQP
jgi:hypothetical protein